MTVLGFLIPAALLLGLGGLAAFMWTVKAGQYEDLDGAAERILIDDEADRIAPPSSIPDVAPDQGGRRASASSSVPRSRGG